MDSFKDMLEETEDGNYNVAKPYSISKIMKHLYLCDEYQAGAIFGEHEGVYLDPPIIRIKSLKKLIHTLRMIIENSLFAVKKAFKGSMENDYKKLELIETHISKTYKVKRNNITKTTIIIIQEDAFKLVLNEIIKIKFSVNDYLNKSNLIFIHTEEYDPKAHKERLIQDAKTRG